MTAQHTRIQASVRMAVAIVGAALSFAACSSDPDSDSEQQNAAVPGDGSNTPGTD